MLDRGRRLGVDVGSVRIGVAICDPDGLVATPLVTLPAASAVESILELITEYQIVEIVIGLPTHLKGVEGAAAESARTFGERLADLTTIAITFVDERFTSKSASAALRKSGVSSREQRGLVDQVAASSILQTYLDSHQR